MKKFTVSFFILILVLSLTVTAFAADAQKAEIDGCDVLIAYIEGHDGDMQTAADRFYVAAGYNQSSDGIVMLIDTVEGELASVTSGRCVKLFPDKTLYKLEDTIIPYLRSRDYDGANKAYFSFCRNVIENGAGGSKSGVRSVIISIAVSLVAGFLLGALPLMRAKSELKSVRRKVYADGYERPDSFTLHQKDDMFVNRNVTRVPIPKAGSKSGGGFSGGSTMHSHGGNSFGGHSRKF